MRGVRGEAGVFAGRADLVAACGAHPLYRVCRPGGLVLTALQEVVLAYLDRRAHELPLWRMATTPVDTLRQRAEALVAGLGGSTGPGPVAAAVVCASVAGGGALPGVEIPSWGVALQGDRRAALLRHQPRAIIARVQHDVTVIDLRTVDPADDRVIAAALSNCL